MFKKKKESYVTKANKQMMAMQVPEAHRTLLDGLDDYHGRILKALNPYPTADAALLVVVLRNIADSIYLSNPSCVGLVADITKRFTSPKIKHKEKFETTKAR